MQVGVGPGGIPPLYKSPASDPAPRRPAGVFFLSWGRGVLLIKSARPKSPPSVVPQRRIGFFLTSRDALAFVRGATSEWVDSMSPQGFILSA